MTVGSGCAWVWAEVEAIFGADSGSQDAILVHEGKAGVVVRQDFGATNLELGATLADQYAIASWDSGYEQFLRFDGAYLRLAGEDWLVSLGRQKSIANFYDDEALTNLLLNSEGVSVMGQGGSWLVGGNGVQVFVGDQLGWSAGVAIEALGEAAWSTFRPFQPEPKGTLVGVVNYGSEMLTAHSTVLVTGLLDGGKQTLVTHSGFTAQTGRVALVAALATEYDKDTGEQTDEWMVSAALPVGDVEFAATVSESRWNDRQYDLTADWSLTPILAVGTGGEWTVGDSYLQRIMGAWIKLSPTEGLDVRAGAYRLEDDYDVFNFAILAAEWLPTKSTKLSGRATWWSNDDYKLELSAKQRIN
ncbi:MAG: hypothetical protein ACTHLT_00570 [Devosia sp.]